MTTHDRCSIHRNTRLRYLLRRVWAGVSSIQNHPVRILCLLGFLLVMALVYIFRGRIFGIDDLGVFAKMADDLYKFALLVVTVPGLVFILYVIGTPRGSIATHWDLIKVGMTNSAGEAPVLIIRYRDKYNPRLTVYEFDPCGIPLEEWTDKQAKIEAALNITIAKITWGKDRHIIRVYAVPAEGDLPMFLQWKDEYLSHKNFELVLGQGITGPVSVNLSKIPHILLGGSTGSGKTVLLKLLLMQALQKGAEVYISDFKGGVDYPAVWHRNCYMVFDEDSLLALLTRLVDELERRKRLLQESGYPNIDEHNKATGENLRRYIFACDEVAEVLDKTGLTKEQKEHISQIENKLSTIARQGRAFGIHLMLATQRPDANILPGQIKNNIDFRVCGRADNILSQIILDNTDAAALIPKDARGRFITADGIVFQGYYINELKA